MRIFWWVSRSLTMSGTGCYEHNILIFHHVSTHAHPITLTHTILSFFSHFVPWMPVAVPYGRLILDNGRPSPPPFSPSLGALIYLIDVFRTVSDVFPSPACLFFRLSSSPSLPSLDSLRSGPRSSRLSSIYPFDLFHSVCD